MLLGVSVIMLGTTDMPRSIAFYRDKLGLQLTSVTDNNNFAFFDAGGTTLALSRNHAELSPTIAGATEVVFGCDAVASTYEQLKNKGIEFRGEPRDVNGQEWAAAFLDPDGHILSIFGPR